MLFGGAALYGKLCEKVFGPDDRKTPAYTKNDGVDYVPMKGWKNSLINLLNIAGTGPILGPIQGILFGPIAFITIPIGNVIGGAMHDYFSGMICLRDGGTQMPDMVKRYTNKGIFNYSEYFANGHFFPIFFVTVACGILSGFHSTQTAIISRTMKSERQGRNTFYNMMILEGFIAMVWAAGAMGVYNLGLQAADASLATKTVGIVCKDILGNVGGIIALLGVIVLPITSGDTALRALRLTVADSLHIKQDSNGKRLALSAVIFALVAAILVWAKSSPEGFSVLWRYFAWANQTLALFAFVCISVWMFENGKSKWVWMPLIPGAFYAFVTITYIMNAAIGFNLPWTAAYIIGTVCAAAYLVGIIMYGKKRAAKVKLA